MKKKFLCFLSALITFSAHADELKNFNELKSSIYNGKKINIVVLLDQCKSTENSSNSIAMSGTFSPDAFMISKDQILASDLHFTRNSPGYKNQSVFEFTTYRFSTDNKVTLLVQTLKATNYSPLGKERILNCSVTSSVKLFSDTQSAAPFLIKR